jgi:hypothetical protein
MLLRILGFVGLTPSVAGILLANAAFACALMALYELSRVFLPRRDAERAAVLCAVFPLAYVFSMVYPESLVLGLAAVTGLAAIRRRWLVAASCAALATLTRPEGIMLVVPLAALVVSQRRQLAPSEAGRALAAVLAAPAALASFLAYLGWTLHDPFAWSRAQQAWGRSFRPDGLLHALTHFSRASAAQPWLYRDVAFFAVYVLLFTVAWRAGLPRAWILAGAMIVLVPLASGSFESDGRFGLLAVPVYWGLAVATRKPWVGRTITGVSLGLLAAATLTLPLTFP